MATVAALCLACTSVASSQAAAPRVNADEGGANTKLAIFDKVGIDQKLNSQVPMDLQFTDEHGQKVKLGQYFGKKPVLLTLVYFQCPMLCSQVLSGLTGTLNGIVRFNVGRDFEIVTVSFDPRDTTKDAAANKDSYIRRYRREGAAQGWHFLTGTKDQIDALASAVGFRYAWDPEIQQFAHGSALMLLTPDGRMAQYYYGIEYAPRDVQLGLIEASKGKIGNVADQIMLYCYHYDPAKGKYGAAVFNILRLSALATMLVLGGFIIVMFRRESLAARQSRLQTRTAE
jgi:protein SCO1